jgi:glycosyltransferase involved in cell wall biosynthesis
MPRLRVALVAPSLNILGGQAVQADRLLRMWKDDPDVEAWLVPVNPDPPPLLRTASKLKYVRTVVNELVYVPLLARELLRADVVHVFSASYWSFLLAPLPAILVARALNRPVLLNYRSGEAPDHLSRSMVARWGVRLADRNVVPSRFLAGVFAHHDIATAIIPNIVDVNRFHFRARTPLRPRFLSTRNFEPLYNVACTLRAFRVIQQHRPDAALTLVGGGSEEGALRALARELGLHRVTFAGRVHPDAIADQYAAHDIYIQSPSIDNMPTSVLEAFASGLPVVSTEAGGMPAIVTHGVHGLLAPIDDHVALARHALDLLDDEASAARYARAAREAAESCTWAAVRGQWLRTYRALAAPHETLAPARALPLSGGPTGSRD